MAQSLVFGTEQGLGGLRDLALFLAVALRRSDDFVPKLPSLRAGLITSAPAAGADILRVMDQLAIAVRSLKAYDRRAKAFKGHAGKAFL